MLVPVLGVLLALVLSGCSNSVGGAQNGYIAGDGQTIRIDPADRGAPIDLSGDDLNGKPLDVASYRGKPVIINVWGSWCVPCRTEMPMLLDIQKDLADTAPIIGINIRETDEASGLAFMRNKGADWPSIFSPDGKALRPFVKLNVVNPAHIPTTLVLDAEGRVAASVQGEITTPGTFIRYVRDIAAGN